MTPCYFQYCNVCFGSALFVCSERSCTATVNAVAGEFHLCCDFVDETTRCPRSLFVFSHPIGHSLQIRLLGPNCLSTLTQPQHPVPAKPPAKKRGRPSKRDVQQRQQVSRFMLYFECISIDVVMTPMPYCRKTGVCDRDYLHAMIYSQCPICFTLVVTWPASYLRFRLCFCVGCTPATTSATTASALAATTTQPKSACLLAKAAAKAKGTTRA